MGEMPILSGMVYCADCGRKLYQVRGPSLEKVKQAEQKQLKSRLSELQKEIDSVSGLNDNAGRFLDLVRKYDSITELDAEIIRTFVSKVIVHRADKSGGHRRQQIDVEFNLIGEVVLPE